MRQAASGVRTECHEPGDQFGIDPVRLGLDAPALPEGFGLRRRELTRLDSGFVQVRPKPPLAAARGLEADQRLPVAGGPLQFRVACGRVRQAKLAAVGQAMNVKPVARDVQADDCWMC